MKHPHKFESATFPEGESCVFERVCVCVTLCLTLCVTVCVCSWGGGRWGELKDVF